MLIGCAAAPAPPVPAPTPASPAVELPAPAGSPQPPAADAPQLQPPAETGQPPLNTVLAHADRLRTLPPPELAQEIARLNDTGGSPVRQMQLALALLQTQAPADGQRANGLLQRVLAQDTPEARQLHPLARLIATQYTAQRRAEEQAERSAQQLRDGQRRIDQLNERLEALRAIERSMPSRPAP
ncbi:translation initiation factors-like protein [Ramlibacter tataouinensis TTB310]|uniref:Translation initiation factors-like protein n=2 Tax=Ramlibacter tataouinensis TaxID=94132 RepID=F5Y005_RAMTT|nr:translation initiation factors-like protein [Ramlibacter tataouinensis TTB310]